MLTFDIPMTHNNDEGRPILVIRSGNFCPATRDLEKGMRYCIYLTEKMLRENKEKHNAGKSVDPLVLKHYPTVV